MNRNVLITGASSGIGKATALLFARNGYDVTIAARTAETLESVAQEIQALGRNAIPVPTDVTKVDQVNALAETAIAAYGHVDVLVNNAGVCLTGSIESTSLEDWQNLMNVNLWGYLYTIQALLPQFLAQGKGTMINVGSIGGKMPLPQMTAYCTTKYAVTGLTEALRLELQPKGIEVCAVHPGVTKSQFLERTVFRGHNEQEVETAHSRMNQAYNSPLASSPEEVAQVIWHSVNHPQAEMIVGASAIAATAYRLAPNLIQWTMQQSLYH